MIRKYVVALALFLCLLSACSENKTTDQLVNNIKKSDYPSIIDSLGLQNLYDKTKWLMYCYQCDDSIAFVEKKGEKETITYGTLELKFDTLSVENDEMEINFSFFLNGQRCDKNLVRNSPICGVIYKNKTDSVRFYVMDADVVRRYRASCPDPKNCPVRFVNPLQPSVIKYITGHKSTLNTWFYSEAIKHGVLAK